MSQRLNARAIRRDATRIDNYLEVFCTTDSKPRKNHHHQSLRRQTSRNWPAAARHRTRPRLRACSSASSRCARANAARALLTIADAVIARYAPRERTPRAARLRRPDRQDARAVRARLGRLGALQARSRHRPRADRRGAGHQPEAMGDHQHHLVASSPPAARARTSRRTIFAVGDEKQSIFSFQGAAPRAFDDMRAIFRASSTGRNWASEICVPLFIPLRRRSCSARSTRCFSAESLSQRHHRRGRHDRASNRCRRRARRGRNLWPLIAPDESARRSKAGTRPSIPRARPARASSSRARSPTTVKTMDARGPAGRATC